MDNSLLENALRREKKARHKAEQLLEDKSRELFLAMRHIEDNNATLLRQKNALEVLNTLVTFAQGEKIGTHLTLERYLVEICAFTHWKVGHIYFYHPEKNPCLRPSDIWHLPDQQALNAFKTQTMQSAFSISEGLPGKVLEAQKPIWMEDLFDTNSSPRGESGKESGLKGAYGIPLFRYHSIFAIAEFFSEHTQEEDSWYLEFAANASNQVATVLERRYIEKDIKQKNIELNLTLKELKETQSQLLQSSKLASIGQLAAGVAHEINNPIGYVSSNTSVLKKYIANIKVVLNAYHAFASHHEQSPQYTQLNAILASKNMDYILTDIDNLLDESIEGLSRVTDIVADLKSFSRVDEAKIKPACINECIESTLKVIANEIKYKCEVKKEYAKLPQIKCNPGKLNQVFMNLFINASQAIDERGELSIQTLAQNEQIVIRISDSGCGIPKENLERLFDPFFTTKAVGVGTGLGLSISYGIIQEHGGTIDVQSEENKGTTFTLSLPVTPPASLLPKANT